MSECLQCGKDFLPKSKVNVFCSRACQLDNRNGRAKEETVRRQETGFAWEPVRAAAPITIKRPKNIKSSPAFHVAEGWKTAAILPDQQFGYRCLIQNGGQLVPFHDPRAVDIAEQIVDAEQPEQTICLGDVVDLAAQGKYRQEPEFVGAVQPGIDRASAHLATVSDSSQSTIVLRGNHDIRFENYCIDNAQAASGIRRARRKPGEFPVTTIEFLLGTEEMTNVEWVGHYPAGAHYILDDLACIHGRVTGASLAYKVINSERVTTIFGHVHRHVDETHTFNLRGAPLFVRAYSPGCLARIDGAVPSVKSGRDQFIGHVTSWEDWSQGMAIVRYCESREKFTIEDIRIMEGEAMHRGHIFTSLKNVNDPERELLGPEFRQKHVLEPA